MADHISATAQSIPTQFHPDKAVIDWMLLKYLLRDTKAEAEMSTSTKENSVGTSNTSHAHSNLLENKEALVKQTAATAQPGEMAAGSKKVDIAGLANDNKDFQNDFDFDEFFALLHANFPAPMITALDGLSIQDGAALLRAFVYSPLKNCGFPSLDNYKTALARYTGQPLAILQYPTGIKILPFKGNKALKRNLVKVVEYIVDNLEAVGANHLKDVNTRCKSFTYHLGSPVYDCYLLTVRLFLCRADPLVVDAEGLGVNIKALIAQARSAEMILERDNSCDSALIACGNLRVSIDQVLEQHMPHYVRVSRDSERQALL